MLFFNKTICTNYRDNQEVAREQVHQAHVRPAQSPDLNPIVNIWTLN